MFACIQSRSVSKLPSENIPDNQALIDLAFTFSPLVEHTADGTVVLDIAGQDLLFGPRRSPEDESDNAEKVLAQNIAQEIVCRARQLKLPSNVGVAANPDAAIHAARCFPETTIINIGDEGSGLERLAIRQLDYSLAGIDPSLTEDIQETFSLWGIRTFGDLAKLPLAGVAERLGQEGVRLQKLAQGQTDRRLHLVRPAIGFEQTLELEHPVEELEPLSFILSRLLNQLCANLIEYALATNELRLQLTLEDKSEHNRTITLPVAMQNSKTLMRLLLFDIEAQPPPAPIVAVTIRAEPVQPRAAQTGLFIPLAPEPEKLEITLARLAKLVGQENVGSPELLDTHRPDAFRLKRFSVAGPRKRSNRPPGTRKRECVLGFRNFRPPWRAEVQMNQGRPVRINAHGANSFNRVRGKIGCASGPWRASGDWWRSDVWARDEWDIVVIDGGNQTGEVLCRIFCDRATEEWFVAGIYD